MNRQTDFAVFLNRFLTDYLPNKRGSSPKTIDSYRYSFIFLIEYYEKSDRITPDKLKLSDITYEKIAKYFDWLQEEKRVSVSTRNQRQAAVNSFVRFLMYERPEYLNEYQRILAIPVKKAPQKRDFLSENGWRSCFNGYCGYLQDKWYQGLCDPDAPVFYWDTCKRTDKPESQGCFSSRSLYPACPWKGK